MLPTINGKEIIDCKLEDIQCIIDNPDYAENEYLEYKKAFSIDVVENDKKQQEQVEFRNDVCAFANANGGYLIIGIDEKKGVPSQITGISITNNSKDLFERDIKNYLQSIKPRTPYYRIHFIDLPEDKYIVIMFIQHDFFAPYIHLADQKNYKIYKRARKGKMIMDYQEIKTMFTQSINLETEIERVRSERIGFFLEQEDDQEHTYSQFFLMHILPETFFDYNYNKSMFVLEHKGARFAPIFLPFDCVARSVPTPEGLRYLGSSIKAECKLNNNGVAEFFYPIRKELHVGLLGENDKGQLQYRELWQKIENSIHSYVDIMYQYIKLQRFFVCFSVIGCKDVLVEKNNVTYWSMGIEETIDNRLDRNKLLCYPSVFELTKKGKINDNEMSRAHLDFLTSLGVKYDQTIHMIIEKIYGENHNSF